MDHENLIIEQGEVVCYLSSYIDEIWIGGVEEVDALIAKLTELSAELKATK